MAKNKISLIAVLILLILSVIFVNACSEKETTAPASTKSSNITPQVSSPFTQEELEQLVADSLQATNSAQTYKMNMDIATQTILDGGSNINHMSIKAQTIFDVIEQQMFMSAVVTNYGTGSEMESNNVDVYVFTDYVYVMASIPELGEQWIKVPVTPEVLDNFNANMMQEEMDVLSLPESIEFIKYDTVSGTECYVLKIIPNNEYLDKYARDQIAPELKVDWDKIQDISAIYDELFYLVWIAKDSRYVHRMEINCVINLDDSIARSTQYDFDTAIMNVEGAIQIFDYDIPVSIVLPAEAENAISLSSDDM